MNATWLVPVLVVLVGVVASDGGGRPPEIHVSVHGDDEHGDGSEANPFAGLVRARDEARRRLAEDRSRGARVTLHGGVYRLTSTFELGEADSGPDACPMVYRAAPGQTVVLSGGTVLSGFVPVADEAVLRRLDPAARGRVYETDLRGQGIGDYGDYDEPQWHGFQGRRMGFYVGGEPMVEARWPNESWARVESCEGEEVVPPRRHLGGRPTWRSGGLVVPDPGPARPDRFERWAEEPALMAHGFWYYDWAGQRMAVESVDPAGRIIRLRDPDRHPYGYRPGQRFYLFNALCELDAPGEWYVDREAGRLFVYPPEGVDLNAGEAVVSRLSTPLATIAGASNVVVRGLVFAEGRGPGLVVSGGRNVRVVGCEFRNLGDSGVQVSGGSGHAVQGCDVHRVAGSGVSISGGDPASLTPGGHEAVNNHIHRYGYYRPNSAGLSLAGVGNRVANNLIHTSPHTGIVFRGNDHRIEFNEIHSVCLQTYDSSAIYAGRNWAWRGNVIRHNYIHHVYSAFGVGRRGVYLDDMFSSAEVTGNLFFRVTLAAFIGGGRDNRVENNLFIDCDPAIYVDARALNWAHYHADRWLEEAAEKGTLQGVAFDRPPYSERYPELAAILEGTPKAPEGNVIARNIVWGGTLDRIHPQALPYLTMEDNLFGVDPRFVDPEGLDFRLRDDSPAWAIGFEPIPVERIGLIHDETRASWPVEHEVAPGAVERPVVAPREPPPEVRARRVEPGAVTVDGRIGPAEWGEPAILLKKTPGGDLREPASRAWIAHDGSALLVAVDVLLAPGNTISRGGRWGADDAVEIALLNRAAGPRAPIWVWRGYACGAFESSGEAGAPDPDSAARGVLFAARIEDLNRRWSAEWRIPFESMGGIDLDPVSQVRLPFNLTVRKAGESLWQMWRATGSQSWRVEEAGILVIE